MKKSVLVVSSARENLSSLFEFFLAISGEVDFRLLSSVRAGDLVGNFKENGFRVGYYIGWFSVEKRVLDVFFLIMYPFYLVIYFFYCIFYVFRNKVDVVVCVGLVDKVVFSLIFKLFKCRLVWIELPGDEVVFNSKIAKTLYKLNRGLVNRHIVFSNYSKERLKIVGVKEEKLEILLPGFRAGKLQEQDDLFKNIVSNRRMGRRYFTVGVITDLVETENVKILFQAIEKCKEVIPNIQLIVIGDGLEKKALGWLAKTMKLESMIWFVGRQVKLRKWIDNFDCFVVTNIKPNLVDFSTIFAVMYSGVPVVAQRHVGLEDFLAQGDDKMNTLIDVNNLEVLYKKIIEIEQDAILRQKIGEMLREKVVSKYMFDGQVEKFRIIINS